MVKLWLKCAASSELGCVLICMQQSTLNAAHVQSMYWTHVSFEMALQRYLLHLELWLMCAMRMGCSVCKLKSNMN